jgi:hypothetical protein
MGALTVRPNIRAISTAAFAAVSCLLIASDKGLPLILKAGAVGVISLATYAIFSEESKLESLS